jgi:hypothetical protein
MAFSRVSIEEPLLSSSSPMSSFLDAVKSSTDDPNFPELEDQPISHNVSSTAARPGILAIEATA